MEYLTLISLLFLLIISVIIIMQLLMIQSVLKNKKYKSKEDYFILQNQIFTFIILSIIFIYIIIWITGKYLKYLEILYGIINYLFGLYIILLYSINCMIVLDYYYSYTYPIHFFSYLLKLDLNVKSYHQLLFACLIIIPTIFDLLYCEIDFIKDILIKIPYINLENNYFFQCMSLSISKNDINKNIFPFILTNRYKGFILILINIYTLIYIIIFLCKIGNFYFKKTAKLKKKLRIKFFIHLLYLLYAVSSTYNLYDTTYIELINSFLLILIIFIDNLVLFINYSLSKIVQIKARKSFIGKIGSKIKKCFNKQEQLLLTDSTEQVNNSSSLLMEDSYNNYRVSVNPFEQELLLMYQNDIIFEDYYLNYFDQFLNVITCSLYKLYKSNKFSTKEINNQKLSQEMNLSASSISGGVSGLNGSFTNQELIIDTENLTTFNFNRNDKTNDFLQFQDVLENSHLSFNGNLQVKIHAYYINNCVNNIFEKNYTSNNIAKSLINHMLIKNISSNDSTSSLNQDITTFNFFSLTVSNAKELYFKNLKNICFKTFDKKYTLEMFETNEDPNDLIITSLNNKNNLSDLINKYFLYIETKGINNTFLPIILGIFKIKINHFKSLLIIVSDNAMVENIPYKNFTNWQLIRFKEKGLAKIGSSRYNRNAIVEDDIIFRRGNWNDKKLKNVSKIQLINYEEVKNILLSDINFLKKSGCYKYDLLLMYYEYDGKQKPEIFNENDIIKIKNTKGSKRELIDDFLFQGNLFNDSISSSNSDSESIKKNTVHLNLNENDNEKNDKNSTQNEIKLINENIIKFSEQININGYDGVFDNYNCLCFFAFENIFENHSYYQYQYAFHKNYMKKIMKYFTKLKNTEKNDINKDAQFTIN